MRLKPSFYTGSISFTRKYVTESVKLFYFLSYFWIFVNDSAIEGCLIYFSLVIVALFWVPWLASFTVLYSFGWLFFRREKKIRGVAILGRNSASTLTTDYLVSVLCIHAKICPNRRLYLGSRSSPTVAVRALGPAITSLFALPKRRVHVQVDCI